MVIEFTVRSVGETVGEVCLDVGEGDGAANGLNVLCYPFRALNRFRRDSQHPISTQAQGTAAMLTQISALQEQTQQHR